MALSEVVRAIGPGGHERWFAPTAGHGSRMPPESCASEQSVNAQARAQRERASAQLQTVAEGVPQEPSREESRKGGGGDRRRRGEAVHYVVSSSHGDDHDRDAEDAAESDEADVAQRSNLLHVGERCSEAEGGESPKVTVEDDARESERHH